MDNQLAAEIKLLTNSLCLGAETKDTTLSSGSSNGSKSCRHVDKQFNYSKMKSVAAEKGLTIVDVPVDGDCALHAVIRQLQQLGTRDTYDVRMLRQLAVEYLDSHRELVNLSMLRKCYAADIRSYLKQQSIPGTPCDENMLHAVAYVTGMIVRVFHDNGHTTTFEPSATYRGNAIKIGQIADAHYVSLEARDRVSNRDSNKPGEFPTTSLAPAADTNGRLEPCKQDRVPKGNQEAVLRYSHSKLESEAKKRRLRVVDVAQTGDSALHAVVSQLHLQNNRLYDVTSLRKRAVDYLYQHKYLIDTDFSKAQSYLSAQSAPGTLCDETMLSAVSEVIMKEIHILQDGGTMKKLGKQTSHTKPVIIGVYAKVHYVSLEPPDTKEKYGSSNDEDKSSRFQNDVAQQHTSPSAADAGNHQPPTAASNDSCAICMDVIKDPKTLPCNHVFCSHCIDQSMAYQPKCPCCGKLFGVLKGDQPEGGSMHVRKNTWQDLEGYPRCGSIVIDYYLPDGRQKVRSDI